MNFVVKNQWWTQKEEDQLFQGWDLNDKDPVTYIESHQDMFDILVDTGLFKSRSEARKNWTKTTKEIPQGFTLLEKLGKRHLTIAIWVPIA